MADLARAASVIVDGKLAVYPTETVYGLGADALDSAAVERVFAAKDRDRSKPISLAVPSVDDALEYVRASERERAFMREFLPGPVTVLCERRSNVPDVLTAGSDRVGVRIPDCELAQKLCAQAATPITATSANRSGNPNARRVADLDLAIETAAAAIVDGGETPGTESTVVDVSTGIVHRAGARHHAIAAWLESA